MKIGFTRTTTSWICTAALIFGLAAVAAQGQGIPIIEVGPTDTTAPTNFTATFGVFTSGATGFRWYFNGQLIAGATNHVLNIIDAQVTNQGAYVVVATNSSGNATNAPVTLTVTNVASIAPSIQLTTIASFSEFADGGFPQAGVIQASDGYLYGTTLAGGTNASGTNGTVFKMSTNGTLVWSYAFDNTHGRTSAAGLAQAGDGNLYGTTGLGGLFGYGTAFRITTNGALTTIYNFDTGFPTNGANPQAALCVGADGFLYGTTSTNGTGNYGGTVFKMSTNGGSLVWGVPLTSATGTQPLAGLVQGLDGRLYGTTEFGGSNSAGTVFSIGTNGTGVSNLYSFTGNGDGGYPAGGLVQGPDGQLYGTTTSGGNFNVNGGQGYGTIFKITTNGSAFTLLQQFNGTNGGSPEASLMLAADGNFYGTGNAGGVGYPYSFDTLFGPIYGNIFQFTTNGALTSLVSFNGNYNGDAPHSSLWQGRDGGLYGTTSEGGTNDLSISGPNFGDGTVFRLAVVRPAIESASAHSGTFSFTWNAAPNVPYQAQYKDNLTQPAWISLGAAVTSTNGVGTQTDTIGVTNKARFYRVSDQF